MKKLLKKARCYLFGHKWLIMYVYSGSRVKCKCNKCEVEKENYIWEFLN